MATLASRTQLPPHVSVRELSPGFGFEVIGIDLTKPISPADAETVRQLWIETGLLLFRNPAHDDEAQMQFSRLFGEMEPAATAELNDPTNRFMMSLKYDPNDKDPKFQQHYNVGGMDRAGWLGWHWDQAFMPTIVRGAVLRMVDPAAQMGATGFIDAIGAWDRLSPELQKRIDGLEVVYEFNPDFASGQFGFPKDIRPLPRDASLKPITYSFPPVVHPMVITQYETGRKVLKLSPMHARYILGMDKAESDALLSEVAEHLVDPSFAYFHKWQKNDMLVWDNWRTIHGAEGVPLNVARMARRTTIMGDYEVGRYLDPSLDRNREVKRLVD